MIDVLGYLGIALLIAGLPVHVALLRGTPWWVKLSCLVVASAVSLIPWAGASLVFYLRGVVGDLSISSTVLLVILLTRAIFWPRSVHRPISGHVGWSLLVLQLPLYASTLGYWQHDLYGWGYQPGWMLPMLAVVLCWAWQVQPAWAIAWLVGIAAFATGWLPSRNLWDALVDPVMALAAGWITISAAVRAVWRKQTVVDEPQPAVLRQAA